MSQTDQETGSAAESAPTSTPTPSAALPQALAAGNSGLAAVLGDDFSFSAAIGGVRGAIESILPALAFVVVFVVSRSLLWSIVISAAMAVICLVARLVSRGQVRSALTGAASLLICLVWAWFSRSAKNFYAPGFLIDGAWALALLVSVTIRIPGIGAVVELFRSNLSGGFSAWLSHWRADRRLVWAYVIATWLWIGLFLARLLVQVPLYLANLVGLLGTARLVMGIPLMGLVLWLSWLLISPQIHRQEVAEAAEAAAKTEAAGPGRAANATDQVATSDSPRASQPSQPRRLDLSSTDDRTYSQPGGQAPSASEDMRSKDIRHE